MGDEFRVGECFPSSSTCPHCGDVHTGAFEVGGDDARPGPGYYSICAICGQLAIYDSEIRLRKLGSRELAAAMKSEEWPTICRALEAARATAAEMRRLGREPWASARRSR